MVDVSARMKSLSGIKECVQRRRAHRPGHTDVYGAYRINMPLGVGASVVASAGHTRHVQYEYSTFGGSSSGAVWRSFLFCLLPATNFDGLSNGMGWGTVTGVCSP